MGFTDGNLLYVAMTLKKKFLRRTLEAIAIS